MLDNFLYNINGFNLLIINVDTNNYNVKSYIDTGYIHETVDNLGINHLLEHVLINSNSNCNSDCITEMNKRGIIMNATTGLNMINYYISGLESDLYLMIKFIVESSLKCNNINKNIIEKEKNAVLNELLQYSNNNLNNVYNAVNNNIYNIEGLQHFFNYEQQIYNLKKFNEKNLKEFCKKFYDKVLFVISGKINNLNDVNNIKKKFKNVLNPYKVSNNKNRLYNCFNLENNNTFFIQDDNMNNTTILISFRSSMNNTIENMILLDISCKYIYNVCMDELRAKLNLIYGIQIEPTINICGSNVLIKLNVSNDNSKYTLYKFMNILNKCKNKIDRTFIDGIKKKYRYKLNINDINDKISYYENSYINKLFNNSKDDILTYNEYNKKYMKVSSKKIQIFIENLFDFNKMLIVYTSKVKIQEE
jgi:predicted Zn-dependent peptidase